MTTTKNNNRKRSLFLKEQEKGGQKPATSASECSGASLAHIPNELEDKMYYHA